MVNLLVATGTSGFRQAYSIAAPNNTLTSATIVYVNGSEDFAVMAVCLVAVACVLAVRNGDVPYALVAIWALGGVYRGQASKAVSGFPEAAMSQKVADWATAMMVLVAVAAAVGLVKSVVESVHAWRLIRETGAEKSAENDSGSTSVVVKSGMHYTDEKST